MRIPTYQDVLEEARFWRDTNELPELQRAEAILRAGMAEHRYALPLGDELALVLEKQGRDADALALLQELESLHQNAGEETLCRFGRIYKKRADRLLATGALAPAEPSLADSERYYHLAYEKSHGFYPRINELTVRFVRAGVAAGLEALNGGQVARGRPSSAELLRSVRAQAGQMLVDPAVWRPCKDDDHVWIPATRAEAHFLMGQWHEAELAYREAMAAAAGRKFYHDCMAGQVRMLLGACERLSIAPAGPLCDPETFFAISPGVGS